MRIPVASICLLSAASFAIAGATACSSSSAVPPTLGGPSLPSAASTSAGRSSSPEITGTKTLEDVKSAKKGKKPLLYIADFDNYQIDVFDQTKSQSPAPKYVITDGVNAPTGITTDTAGNLYVANEVSPGSKGGPGSISIYKPGAKRPFKTITTGVNGPEAVAVDSGGNIFVANDPILGSTRPWINEYPAGATSPSYTWYPPQNNVAITSLALLSPNSPGESTIYAPYYTLNPSGLASGDIMDCYPGNTACFSVGYSFGQTGGIAVAESPFQGSAPFDFLIVDQYVPGVDNFASNSLSWQFNTGGTPQDVALDSTRTELYVSNLGSVTEYSYPSMNVITKYHSPVSGGLFLGVATSPAGTFF
jgi:hypothetical protein